MDTFCSFFGRYCHPDETEGLVKLHLNNAISFSYYNLLHVGIPLLGCETAADKSQTGNSLRKMDWNVSAKRTETAPAPLQTAQLLCGHHLLQVLSAPSQKTQPHPSPFDMWYGPFTCVEGHEEPDSATVILASKLAPHQQNLILKCQLKLWLLHLSVGPCFLDVM